MSAGFVAIPSRALNTLLRFCLLVAAFVASSQAANIHYNPAVNMTSPVSGSIYPTGYDIPLSAKATASDGASILLVEFFANDVKVAETSEGSNSIYYATWTNAGPDGSYTLEAVATDSFGARGHSGLPHIVVSSTLTNQFPLVSIIEPVNGSTVRGPGNVLIHVNARDNDGSLVRVDFYEGGNKIGETNARPFDFVWPNAPLGEHTVTAVAIDNLGASNSSTPAYFKVANIPAQVIRGPYLQNASPTALNLNWRTDTPTDSAVFYGTDADLSLFADVPGTRTNHSVRLTDLSPDTRYYYAVGSSTALLETGPDFWFITPPATGKPTRIWVLGDSGTASFEAASVRDAYYNFAEAPNPDLWLMLGDNAYGSGTDAEYQAAVFTMYPLTLRQSVLWSTRGNHDGDPAYFDIFTLPTAGESGGVASGTESYYSFDYGNIHFICLNAFTEDRSRGGPMLRWLEQDLAQTAQDWIIAFWHHPPYSHGSHDSDTEIELIEMRENAVPILEAYGADLVLCGHSHNYERSFLLNGHYGPSWEFSPDFVRDFGDGRPEGSGAYFKTDWKVGTIYVVSGCSGQHGGGTMDYPAMFTSLDFLGSMVLDINQLRLDAKFLQSDGQTTDHFTIEKAPLIGPPLAIMPSGNQLLITWPNSWANSSSTPPLTLETCDVLGTGDWNAVTNAPVISDDFTSVLVDQTGSSRFFRLRASR